MSGGVSGVGEVDQSVSGGRQLGVFGDLGSWLLSRQSLWACAGAAAVLAIVRNGVGAYPFAGFLADTIAPGLPHLPVIPALFQYVLWSPIGPSLAALVGIDTRGPYLALHAAVLLAGCLLLLRIVRARHGLPTALVVVVLLFSASATTVALGWVGSYDAFTLVLACLLVVVTSPWWAGVIGFLLAFSALEHGIVIIGLLLVLALGRIYGGVRPLLAAAGGLVVGGACLLTWLHTEHVSYGRAYWIQHFGVRYFLDMAAHGWPLLVVSMFATAWPLVVTSVVQLGRRQGLIAAMVLLAPIVPTLLSEDQTRVFAVLSFPPLLAVVLAVARGGVERLAGAVGLTVCLAVVIPGFFVWKGSPHLSDWGPWVALVR